MDITNPAFTLSYVALWLIVLFQTVLLIGIVRFVTRTSSGGPAAHSPPRTAPDFRVTDADGRALTNHDLHGRTTGLVFVSSGCSACTVTFDELRALSHRAKENVVLVCQGEEQECLDIRSRYGTEVRMIVDPTGDLARLFGVDGVPVAVMVGDDGRILSTGEPLRGEDAERLLALPLTSGKES